MTAPLRGNSDLRSLEFSLFFFSGDESAFPKDKYQLVLEATKFADRNGFAAVWTPERHFHRFGGLYPNPAVLGAALAAITERVQIRGGSVIAPLQSLDSHCRGMGIGRQSFQGSRRGRVCHRVSPRRLHAFAGAI